MFRHYRAQPLIEKKLKKNRLNTKECCHLPVMTLIVEFFTNNRNNTSKHTKTVLKRTRKKKN